MFTGEAYIQTEPYRLAIMQADSIVYIPWERIVAFATDRAPEPAPEQESGD
jgi:hypothetical protein